VNINRADIRKALLEYLDTQDFFEGAYTEKDRGSIDALVDHTTKALSLTPMYHKGKGRAYVKKLVSQEIATMKRMGLCRRVTWGRYRPNCLQGRTESCSLRVSKPSAKAKKQSGLDEGSVP
jgi:hypothetical protein